MLLNNPEFTTAVRVAQAVNDKFGAGSARALDAATIEVKAGTQDVIGLIADVGELSVVETAIAKVIVNERTGTVVIGSDVEALTRGGIAREPERRRSPPRPRCLSRTRSPRPARQRSSRIRPLRRARKATGWSSFSRALRWPSWSCAMNELKVTPREIVAILQALKEAGALHAELEIL